MRYSLRAALSIAVAVGAFVVVLTDATTVSEAAGGVALAGALLVFIRAIMSVASDPTGADGQAPSRPTTPK
jgi:hypothetical protein